MCNLGSDSVSLRRPNSSTFKPDVRICHDNFLLMDDLHMAICFIVCCLLQCGPSSGFFSTLLAWSVPVLTASQDVLVFILQKCCKVYTEIAGLLGDERRLMLSRVSLEAVVYVRRPQHQLQQHQNQWTFLLRPNGCLGLVLSVR